MSARRTFPAAAAIALTASLVVTPVPAAPDPGTSKDKEASAICRKLPRGKRIVKLTLKPETELADLLAWISSITCEQFILPGTISAGGKKVTIYSPRLMTPEEAYRLFLDALDSVGLTVYRVGSFLRVIETAKAKTAPLPVYIDDAAD